MASERRPQREGETRRRSARGPRADALDFLRSADEDLAAARVLLQQAMLSYLVLRQSVEAVEKGLKALVIHLTNQMPERTHDLSRLVAVVERASGRLPGEVEAAIDHLDVDVEGLRYPNLHQHKTPGEQIDTAAARDALTHAELVMVWIHAQLQVPRRRSPRKTES